MTYLAMYEPCKCCTLVLASNQGSTHHCAVWHTCNLSFPGPLKKTKKHGTLVTYPSLDPCYQEMAQVEWWGGPRQQPLIPQTVSSQRRKSISDFPTNFQGGSCGREEGCRASEREPVYQETSFITGVRMKGSLLALTVSPSLLLQRQKKPTIEAKETCYSNKRVSESKRTPSDFKKISRVCPFQLRRFVSYKKYRLTICVSHKI